MRRFKIHHEKREKHGRIMLSLAIIIISVSIIANMKTTGFASQRELIDIAMESEHAKLLASENNYAVEITELDAGVLSSSMYTGVPEGAYEVKFVSGSKTVTVIIYNGEVFRTIVG